MSLQNKYLGKLSKKKVEHIIQSIDAFEKPKIELEQYITPPHIASVMINTIDNDYNAICNKCVADLGCGTGTLTIASHLYNASLVHGFDIDKQALDACLENIRQIYDIEDDESVFKYANNINLVCVDIGDKNGDLFWQTMSNKFDTVIMNPPFGTKANIGIDMVFLSRAINIASEFVFSLHKTSTRKVMFLLYISLFI